MKYDLTWLENGCNALGIPLSEHQKQQFIAYYEFLIEKNKVMNLTGITDFDEVITKHFLDSLMGVKALDFFKANSLIDVGTGAGFPGIPLKIVFPHLRVCLLDSLNKRILFLNETIELLQLKDIETVHGRAEDFSRKPEYREKYDLSVSRAVSNLATLSEYTLPFVKKNGIFAAYKSGSVRDELEQAKKGIQILGGEITDVSYFVIPGTDIARSVIKIEKRRNTPGKYPRKAGIPLKEPLGYEPK